jgi:hypothetical protein
MIASRDQRLGAKSLYDHPRLEVVVRNYLAAAVDLSSDWTQKDFDGVYWAALEFLQSLRVMFPHDHSRMVTVLRSNFGAALSTLFKNTVALTRLMENGVSEESSIDAIAIPDQQPSPIYTKVEADRIVLDEGHPIHAFLRKGAVDETRNYLRKELVELGETLKTSNLDRKYVETFLKLTELINFKDDSGAISFGLHVRLVSSLTKEIERELSEILTVKIGATLTHSAYFASQYKDWVEFLANAQAYSSRQSVENSIEAVMSDVTILLEKNSQSVDERIPQSLRFISMMLKGTQEDRKNAIYAGVRGLENICISALKYSYEQALLLIQDAGRKARPTLVRVGAVTIVALALALISNSMPLIRTAPELGWILENLPRIEKLGRVLR